MKKIYIYPEAKVRKMLNSYLNDLETVLETEYKIVTSPRFLRGVLSLIYTCNRTDIYLLNWLEDVPKRKFGFLQVPFVFMFIFLCKIKGAKIVWTLHNKISHVPSFWSVKVSYYLFKYADILLTHSREAFTWYEQRFGQTNAKKYFRTLPTKEYPAVSQQKRIYDILIWGTVTEYKGVDDFLEFLKSKGLLGKYRIMIVGRFSSDSLYQKVSQFQLHNIHIENRSISFKELNILIAQSTIVLFTYRHNSVLSSSALMDTISMNGCVYGPHVGAFKELSEIGIVNTFHNFEDLVIKLSDNRYNTRINKEEKSRFVQENLWQNYARWLKGVLEENNA